MTSLLTGHAQVSTNDQSTHRSCSTFLSSAYSRSVTSSFWYTSCRFCLETHASVLPRPVSAQQQQTHLLSHILFWSAIHTKAATYWAIDCFGLKYILQQSFIEPYTILVCNTYYSSHLLCHTPFWSVIHTTAAIYWAIYSFSLQYILQWPLIEPYTVLVCNTCYSTESKL